MPAIRLFHMAVPGKLQARTFRCLWTLEELEARPFEVCMVIPGQPYAPQMREYGMQRATKLPALFMDGKEISESAVICQVLAERFQSKKNLLGTEDERIERMQWMAFAETAMMLRVPYLPILMDPTKDMNAIRAEVIEPQKQIIAGNVARFEAHFGDHGTPYLLKSGFSIADTMCGWSLYTLTGLGLIDLREGNSPLTLAYFTRLQERAAFKRTEKYAELSPGLYTQG